MSEKENVIVFNDNSVNYKLLLLEYCTKDHNVIKIPVPEYKEKGDLKSWLSKINIKSTKDVVKIFLHFSLEQMLKFEIYDDLNMIRSQNSHLSIFTAYNGMNQITVDYKAKAAGIKQTETEVKESKQEEQKVIKEAKEFKDEYKKQTLIENKTYETQDDISKREMKDKK